MKIITWIISGSASNFNVCPVGAVSKTMRSYFPDSMWLMAEAKAVASSIPGIPDSQSWKDLIFSVMSEAPGNSFAKAAHVPSSA